MSVRRWAGVLLGLLPAGCSFYAGSARDFSPADLDREEGWQVVEGMEFVPQREASDCGAAALSMVLARWGVEAVPGLLFRDGGAPAKGLPAGRLRAEARGRGLKAYLIRGELADLERELDKGRPVLVGLHKPVRSGAVTHYEVVVGIHTGRQIVLTLDPAFGWRQNSFEGFLVEWDPAGRLTLVVFPGSNEAR